jgi:hypothetical protein
MYTTGFGCSSAQRSSEYDHAVRTGTSCTVWVPVGSSSSTITRLPLSTTRSRIFLRASVTSSTGGWEARYSSALTGASGS